MKVSEMIKSLQHMEDTYGDVYVEILHIDQLDHVTNTVTPVYFNYNQDANGNGKCSIQNVPY